MYFIFNFFALSAETYCNTLPTLLERTVGNCVHQMH